MLCSTVARSRAIARPPSADKSEPSKRLRFAPPLTGSPRIEKHVRTLPPVRLKTTVESQRLCWCPPTRGRVNVGVAASGATALLCMVLCTIRVTSPLIMALGTTVISGSLVSRPALLIVPDFSEMVQKKSCACAGQAKATIVRHCTASEVTHGRLDRKQRTMRFSYLF